MHVPEVLYHWRQHATSVSNSGQTFEGSRTSVTNILGRIAANAARPGLYKVASDPFVQSASDACLERLPIDPPSGRLLLLGNREHLPVKSADADPQAPWCVATAVAADVASLRSCLSDCTEDFILLIGPSVFLEDWRGVWDAIKHLELAPAVMAVGGPLTDPDGIILRGAPVRLADGALMDPLIGRPRDYTGPFSLALKPHCVSALYADLMVVRRTDLEQTLAAVPDEASLSGLGLWLGHRAERTGGYVAYDPLLHGRVIASGDLLSDPVELPLNIAGQSDGVGASRPVRGVSAFLWNALLHA